MHMTPDGFVVEEGLDQHYDVLKELGDCHTALGHYDRARQCYEEAALLAPDKAGPHVGRGVIAYMTASYDEAERAFREALRLDARCGPAYVGLAMVSQQRQDYPAAFDFYLKCLELDTDNLTALLGLFQTSCQMGTFGRIIHYLQVYLERHPGDVSVMFCLAALHAREGRADQAREVLLKILALDPNHAEAAALLGELTQGRRPKTETPAR
jgi:tetratricopeptide (TPR) repeat protein